MSVSTTKKRLLFILEHLYKNTDEDNPVTTVEIMNLVEEQGFPIDRKTLREDIRLLIERGYDIVVVKSSPNKYFWGERKFELPELKLLIDAVSSANFINKSKSKELISKLTSLASEEQKKQLKRNVHGSGKVKTNNKRVYYIVDMINDAINLKQKVAFRYQDYDCNKEKVLRNDGELYVISPYALYWNEDKYYVIGFSDKRENVVAFKVDRLCDPELLEEKAVAKPKDFTVEDYGKKIFKMYGGKETLVQLECKTEVMKYIIEQFGADVETEAIAEDIFIAKVPVELSPTFYGWVFQFCGKIKIISPDTAVEDYGNMKNV